MKLEKIMNQMIYSTQGERTEVCEKTPSQGLQYRINADRTTCEIIGVGTCMDRKMIIPSAIDGYTVTAVGAEAFRGCADLNAVSIPDSVTEIKDGAFRGCTGLMAVRIPSFTRIIGNLAFSGCARLALVGLPASVAFIGKAAFGGVGEVRVQEANQNYRSVDGDLYSGDGKTLLHYAVNKKASAFTVPSGVKVIDDYAFFGCMNLTEVTVGDSVTSIGESAFRLCKGLQSAVIGNSVTSLGAEAFLGCENLVSVTLGNAVCEIPKDAFAFCMRLTSVTIPDSVKAVGDRAFVNCESLRAVSIGNAVSAVGRGAFGRCGRLSDVRFAGTCDEWEKIAFSPDWKKGSAIREINFLPSSGGLGISRGLEYRLHDNGSTCEILGMGACKDGTVVIPEMIDDYRVVAIGANAFVDSSLTGVVLFESITDIGDHAFSGCKNLSVFCYAGTKKQWKKITLGKKWRSESSVRRIDCLDKAVRFIFS